MASTASSRVKRSFVALFKIILYTAIIAVVALVVAVGIAMSSLPSFQDLTRRDNLGQMIRVHAADGSVIVSMGPSFGEWLPSDQIPAIMKDAMIAVEDRRFRMHPGIDPIGMARAVKVRFDRGHWSQGGSTITQQLARNIFLTNTRTFGRKGREAILSLALERRFSKDQILELYLNRVYFGGGAYGIDAASRRFFGHSAKHLSIAEAAIIAGMVKAPSNYSPTADVEAARGRAGVVVQAMRENGDISAAQAADSDPQQVKIVPTERQNNVRYFTDWVLPQLDTLVDEHSQPLDVWTTLDPKMQLAADAAINANTPAGAQGALVALDRDGAVRAMVGGKDYVSSIYNRATQATRQPGSSFKLFVYLTALENGHTPNDTIVDEPVNINGWSPRNSTRTYSGPVSLREAFSRSINTISAKLGLQVGFRTIADMAQRFGITTKVNTQPSMVLGTSDVRLIDMTRAFASVSAKGVAVVPYGIRKVTTADGTLLYQMQVDESRVLVAPWVAAQMTDLLQSAVMSGTGRAAQIGRPVAGKTGTTSSSKDGWFIGFSSGLTAGVWMGRDDAKPIPGLQGGHSPAAAFHDFMIQAVANRPVEQFEIQATPPTWQEEPDEETWFTKPDNGQLVSPDGLPLTGDEQPTYREEAPAPRQEPQPSEPQVAPQPNTPPMAREFPSQGGAPARRSSDTGERLDQDWLDRAIGRGRAPPPPPPPRRSRDSEPQ